MACHQGVPLILRHRFNKERRVIDWINAFTGLWCSLRLKPVVNNLRCLLGAKFTAMKNILNLNITGFQVFCQQLDIFPALRRKRALFVFFFGNSITMLQDIQPHVILLPDVDKAGEGLLTVVSPPDIAIIKRSRQVSLPTRYLSSTIELGML